MRVGIAGGIDNPLLGHSIAHLIANGVAISAVLLDAKRMREANWSVWFGRVGDLLPVVQPDEYAEHRIPHYHVRSLNDTNSIDLIQDLDLDIVLNGGIPRIVGDRTLCATRSGFLNIHPGLLPRYRGSCCVEWAVFNDDPVGNTVHFMTPEVDSGPIVLRAESDVRGLGSYEEIRTKVHIDGFQLLAQAAKAVVDGDPRTNCYAEETGGRFYRPIGEHDLATVKHKIAVGRYTYQKKTMTQ